MHTIITSRKLFCLLILFAFCFIIESCKKHDTLVANTPVEPVMEARKNGSAFPHTKQFPSGVATAWFRLLTDITKTKPYTPPPSLRIFAYSGMALYESVLPGMPSYQSMYTHFTGNAISFDHKKNYYWPATANAAIARIASRIMQDYPTPNVSSIQVLESSFNTTFQSQISAAQLQLSVEFGRYVADVIYDWSKADGTFNANGTFAVCPPYVPLGGAGNWVPTPPLFLPAAGVCQGSLRTFIPGVVQAVLSQPHPAYSTSSSSVFYQAAHGVYQSRNNITADELRFVNNWRDIVGTNYNPPAHALRIATNIISKEQLNLEDAAVLFAKQTIAASDVVGAGFYSKFHYALIRPITYVRNVMGHTTWNSTFNTIQHPSYPDEVNASASTVAVLENYFGTNYSFVDSTHKSMYGEWSYPSLQSMLPAIVQSRVNSGLNFRFAGDAGVVQGYLVGEMVDQLPFKKP